MTEWSLAQTYMFRGRAVRYAVHGAEHGAEHGAGPPVVVVHGTPWSSYNLRHLVAGLARDFTVYTYDLPGYGQSDKSPGDVSLGIQNEVLDQLLAHWQLDRPTVIGHDFGGATLLRTHLLNGRDFEKIVLIDPVAVAPWGSSFFRHVQEHEAAFAGVPDYIHAAIVRAYVQTAAYAPLDADVLEQIVAPWLGQAGQPAFYRQIAQASSVYTDAVQPRYGEITRPVLLLWGAEDTWIPQAKGEALHALIPGSELRVIPHAGHLVIEEKPEELIAEIRRFLGVAL